MHLSDDKKNASINSPTADCGPPIFSGRNIVEDIRDECRRWGIKFRKEFDEAAGLEELLSKAESQRAYLKEEGESTLLLDIMVERLHHELHTALEKLKLMR